MHRNTYEQNQPVLHTILTYYKGIGTFKGEYTQAKAIVKQLVRL